MALLSALPATSPPKYKKCFPSGRNSGQRFVFSPRLGSGVEICLGVPPVAGTRYRPSSRPPSGVNTITPSLFHVPPRPEAASQMVWTGPPAMSSFFSFPSAKNARDLPSGDQKGNRAPPVWDNLRACCSPTSSIQSTVVRSASENPTRATVCPLGATSISKAENGSVTEKYSVGPVALLPRHHIAPANKATSGIAHRTQARNASHFFVLATPTPIGGSAVWLPDSRIQLSSLARSRADCHLSSGSFARQRRIAWSRLGGVSGAIVAIGSRSFSRIAEATLSWLFPGKALRPVIISYRTAPSEKMSLRESSS